MILQKSMHVTVILLRGRSPYSFLGYSSQPMLAWYDTTGIAGSYWGDTFTGRSIFSNILILGDSVRSRCGTRANSDWWRDSEWPLARSIEMTPLSTKPRSWEGVEGRGVWWLLLLLLGLTWDRSQ